MDFNFFESDDIKYIHDDEIDNIFTNEINEVLFMQYVPDKTGYISLSTDCFNFQVKFSNNDICDPFLYLCDKYKQYEYEYCQLIFKYLQDKFNKEMILKMLHQTKISNDVIDNIISKY